MAKAATATIHYANKRNGPTVTKKRRPPRPWLISCDEFRELRMCCLLSQKTCAKFLGVSLRTVHNWDTGQRRVPWSAIRLMRLLRQGDLGALNDSWAGFMIIRGKLYTPDGRGFDQQQLRRWSLTVEHARLFMKRYEDEARARGVGRSPAVTLQPEVVEARILVEALPPPGEADSQMTRLLGLSLQSTGTQEVLNAMVHKAFSDFMSSQLQRLPLDSDAIVASECHQIPPYVAPPMLHLRVEGPPSNTGLTGSSEIG